MDTAVGGRQRKKWKLQRVFVCLIVAALVAASCGDDDDGDDAAAAGTDGLTSVRIAYVEGFGSLPVHVAATQGFFEDNGLAVEETPGTDFSLWIQGLDRQFDIVLGIGPPTLGALGAGIDVVGVSGLVRSDDAAPNNPILTNDDSIQSIEDLAGKRVGVLNATGSVAESIEYLVEEGGGEEVALVPTPFPAMPDQLNAGQLDAASVVIPFDAVLLEQGYRSVGDPVVEYAKATTGSDDTANAFFISTRSYADDNPDVIEAWQTSLQQAIDWIAANEAEARQLVVDWLEVPAEVVEIATLPNFSTDLSAEDLEVFGALSQDRGNLEEIPNLEDFIWQP